MRPDNSFRVPNSWFLLFREAKSDKTDFEESQCSEVGDFLHLQSGLNMQNHVDFTRYLPPGFLSFDGKEKSLKESISRILI